MIGAGISGTSFVHYLTEVYEKLDITVFEQSDRIGGKIYSFQYDTGVIFIYFLKQKNQIFLRLKLSTIFLYNLIQNIY